MKRGLGKLQETILTRLPARAELEPYVNAIASLRDFQSTNEELIAAASLLDDCAVLERATVAYLAETASTGAAAVRRTLHGLARHGLAGQSKAQRVRFLRGKPGAGRSATVSAHPGPGRLSYWYRTGD